MFHAPVQLGRPMPKKKPTTTYTPRSGSACLIEHRKAPIWLRAIKIGAV